MLKSGGRSVDGSCNGSRSDDHQSVKFMESELHTVDTHVLVLGRAYFFLIKFKKKSHPACCQMGMCC